MIAGTCTRVINTAYINCSEIDLVVYECEPVGVVLVGLYVGTIASLAVIEVIWVS